MRAHTHRQAHKVDAFRRVATSIFIDLSLTFQIIIFYFRFRHGKGAAHITTVSTFYFLPFGYLFVAFYSGVKFQNV